MTLTCGDRPEPDAYFGATSFDRLFFTAPEQSSDCGGSPTEPEGHAISVLAFHRMPRELLS